MEDINCWQSKFIPCQYSDRLLNRLTLLNSKVRYPVDINEVTKAIYYARKYHGSQMRQSGEPYYSHPIEVAYMVAECIFRTDIIVTSILHDCLEDTELTKEIISDIFGEIIVSQVDDLTRVRIDRKISAAETLNLLFSQNKEYIIHIKLFDRLHNMRTIGALPMNKVLRIVEETLTYFIPFSVAFKMPKITKELIHLCLQAAIIEPVKEKKLMLYPH